MFVLLTYQELHLSPMFRRNQALYIHLSRSFACYYKFLAIKFYRNFALVNYTQYFYYLAFYFSSLLLSTIHHKEQFNLGKFSALPHLYRNF